MVIARFEHKGRKAREEGRLHRSAVTSAVCDEMRIERSREVQGQVGQEAQGLKRERGAHIQKKHEGLRGKVRDLKPEKVECPTCGFICRSKENFRHHNRKHLTMDCHLCGKSLLKSSNFQAHQRRCTKDLSKCLTVVDCQFNLI